MRKTFFFLLAFLLVWSLEEVGPVRAETTLAASVDRQAVAPGERFTLTLTFSGTQSVPAPDLSSLNEFQPHYIGPITRMQSNNGRVEQSVSHRYLLTAPPADGRYTIGSMRIVLDGQALETRPIVISVGGATDADAPAGPSELTLQVIPEVSAPWVGQRVPIVVRLRVGDIRVDDLNYPILTAAGATVEDFAKPSRREEWTGGRRYQILDFRTTLTPLKAGPIDLSDVSMDMTVLEPSANSRRNSLFDDFFSAGRRRSMRLRAEPTVLQVKPLPAAGRPTRFSGAIGTFDFEVEAGPTELSVGDPITLRTRIVGVGNLESLDPPQVVESGGFRVYEPTLVQGDKRTGNVTFEQVLIPKNPGVEEVPSIAFDYFDPFLGTYKVARSTPIAIQVGAAAARSSAIIAKAEPGDIDTVPAELGKDIVYIKDRPGALAAVADNPWTDPIFVSSQGIPVILFFAASFYAKRRAAIHADPRARRARECGAKARRSLKTIDLAKRDIADALTGIIADYLGERLDLPPGRIDKEHVLERLERIGAGDDAKRSVEKFFTAVDTLRYAGGAAGPAPGPEARALAGDVITALEGDRRVAKAVALVLVAALCLVCHGTVARSDTAPATERSGGSAAADGAGIDPMGAFFAGNTSYSEGDYRSAEDAYESALTSGVESAALYFNLGNARFKQGRTGAAIAAYEHSLRLAPRDPDAAANLAFARESAGGTGVVVPRAERYLAPLAARLTIAELTAATVVFWWAAWLLAAAAKLGSAIRRASRNAAIVATLFCSLFAVNLGVRYWHTVWQQWIVVVEPGGTVVRFEPSADGTEHYKALEGGLLELRRTRKGWLQVRSPDGSRGWIPASSVERL